MEFLSSNHRRFRTTKLGDRVYRIAARISLGTLHFAGFFGFPINVQVSIDAQNDTNPIVSITSKIRVEHYFMIFVFGFILTGNLAIGKEPWFVPLIFAGLFVIFHFWFHMVYRVQENYLIKKIRGQLNLIEKSESS